MVARLRLMVGYAYGVQDLIAITRTVISAFAQVTPRPWTIETSMICGAFCALLAGA
jgi:hypothetical protein